MSITFWAPDAPTVKVTPYPEFEPDYEEERSTLPELNVSNSNADSVLRLLGIPFEYCGCIEVTAMSPLIQRLLVVNNSEFSRSAEVRPVRDTGSLQERLQAKIAAMNPGPRTIDCGLTDSRIQRYATTLLALLTQSRQAGYKVCWG